MRKGVLVGVRHAPPISKSPIPLRRHGACACIYSGKGQRGSPPCCPTLPAAPFLPPFSPPLPGQWRRHEWPGRGNKATIPSLYCLQDPPHRLDTSGSMAAVRGVGSSYFRSYLFSTEAFGWRGIVVGGKMGIERLVRSARFWLI